MVLNVWRIAFIFKAVNAKLLFFFVVFFFSFFFFLLKVAPCLCYRHINSGPAELRYTLPFANSVDLDQLASEEAN